MGLTDPPSAVVLGSLGKARDASLDELLGAEAARIVRTELLVGARKWAAAVAPGRAFEANLPGAVGPAVGDAPGPVLLVAPDVPHLSPQLAADALEDLRDGAEIVIGPTNDGSAYFVALPDASDERLALVPLAREELFARASELPGGVGMLRSERRLVSAADARAVAADPATPLELALPLAAGLDVRARRT